MTDPVFIDDAPASSRQRLIKLGAIALVALLAAVFLPKVLLGGGGGGSSVADSPAGAAAPVTTPAPSTPKSDDPVTSASFSDRNPFTALVATSAASDPAAGAAQPDTATGVSTPVVIGVPTVAAPNAPAAPAPAPAPVGNLPIATGQHVTLLDIFTDPSGRPTATVRVDDAESQVVVGQDFGGHFRAISLDPTKRCGNFLYGDIVLPVCVGDDFQL